MKAKKQVAYWVAWVISFFVAATAVDWFRSWRTQDAAMDMRRKSVTPAVFRESFEASCKEDAHPSMHVGCECAADKMLIAYSLDELVAMDNEVMSLGYIPEDTMVQMARVTAPCWN